MKNEDPAKADYPVINGYVYGVHGVTPEEFEKVENSPETRAIDELYERLRNGTATQDEQIDFEISLAEREMDQGRFKL